MSYLSLTSSKLKRGRLLEIGEQHEQHGEKHKCQSLKLKEKLEDVLTLHA